MNVCLFLLCSVLFSISRKQTGYNIQGLKRKPPVRGGNAAGGCVEGMVDDAQSISLLLANSIRYIDIIKVTSETGMNYA
jgi:hypothetical protein